MKILHSSLLFPSRNNLLNGIPVCVLLLLAQVAAILFQSFNFELNIVLVKFEWIFLTSDIKGIQTVRI